MGGGRINTEGRSRPPEHLRGALRGVCLCLSIFLSVSLQCLCLCLTVSSLSLSPSLSLCLAHQPPPFRGAGITRAAACRCPGAQRSLWEGELWVRLLPSRL